MTKIPKDQPNILVIMTDQQKATASHLYGSTFCETPGMARLAAEGVLYEHAYTPHALCIPARISTWTSQFSRTHGCQDNQRLIPPGTPHAFQHWHNQGYQTGLIGKNHCFTEADQQYFDVWCEIEHRSMGDFPTRGMDWVHALEGVQADLEVRCNMPRTTPHFWTTITDFPLEYYSTGLVADQTIRYLEEHTENPFALWVSFPDPHTPFDVPRHYADLFPPEVIDLPSWDADEFSDERWPERNRILYKMLGFADDPLEDVYAVLGAYHGMLRFVDDSVGRILDTLDQLNLRGDTIVVFCSDHGDFSGEHRMANKGGLFYDCLTRVPLIVSWPGQVPQGRRETGFASLIDIVPTLYHLTGQPIPDSMQGEPLPGIAPTQPRDSIVAEYGGGGPLFTLDDLGELPPPYDYDTLIATLKPREAEGRRSMVRTHKWKYVHDPMDDVDELYDLTNDPAELVNVAGDADYAAVKADMHRRWLDWNAQLMS